MQHRGQHYGIAGGGLLGMTLAHRLARAGNRVTLLEAADGLGGLASAWSLGGIVWDRHYHVILLSDRQLLGLLAELGLERELCWTETRTGFYTDGKLYSMSNAVEFLRFPPLSLLEKCRLAATILRASRIRDWAFLEDIPVAEWLERWSGRRTVEKIWLPLLRAKLGEAYRRTSAAFIWATIARMYAARRSGLKREQFGYVRGGYARILDRYAEVLRDEGVEIVLSRPVQRVETAPDGRVRVRSPGGEESVFDQVVLTLPSRLAADLCPELSAEEKTKLRAIEYVGILCASVLLKRPLAGYYVTNITEPWVPFTAVIEMSALVDREQLGGNALVYLPKYLSAEDPLFCRSDREIEDEFLGALAIMYPEFRREDVLSFRISRVKHVFALSTLGYSRRLPSMVTSVRGVHIVNSAHIVNGTLNVNETVQLAERALPDLLSAAAPRAGAGLRA